MGMNSRTIMATFYLYVSANSLVLFEKKSLEQHELHVAETEYTFTVLLQPLSSETRQTWISLISDRTSHWSFTLMIQC